MILLVCIYSHSQPSISLARRVGSNWKQVICYDALVVSLAVLSAWSCFQVFADSARRTDEFSGHRPRVLGRRLSHPNSVSLRKLPALSLRHFVGLDRPDISRHSSSRINLSLIYSPFFVSDHSSSFMVSVV